MDRHARGWVEPVLDMVEPALALEPVQQLVEIHIIVGVGQVAAQNLAVRINQKAPAVIEQRGYPQPVEGRPEHRRKGTELSGRKERMAKSLWAC